MAFYPYALFVHIVGVLGLFIGLGLELVCVLQLRRARSVEQLREWVSLESVIAKLMPITTLLLLLGGLYMVIVSWGWKTGWIDVSLALVIALSVLGPTVNGRRLHAIAANASAGPVSPSLLSKLQDRVLWASVFINVATGLGIVALMTLKPDWIGAIAIIVVAAILGLVAGLSLARTSPALAASQPRYEQTASRS
jgi:hypothetical protein